MKLLIAIIQPDKIDSVKQNLSAAGLGKMTVTPARGCGSQGGYPENYRGIITEAKLIDKVRVEIAVRDEHLQIAIDAIVTAAQTGAIGDGKIFISPLDDCISIRTGKTSAEEIM